MLSIQVKDERNIALSGRLTLMESPGLFRDLHRVIRKKNKNRPESIRLDLAGIQDIDSSGVAVLEEIIKSGENQNVFIELINPSLKVQNILSAFKSQEGQAPAELPSAGFLEALGEKFYYFFSMTEEFLYLMVDTFYWSFKELFGKKERLAGSFVQQSVLIGVNALPIISLLSFLVGFVLALQSAAQLRQFGANIFIAHLIAISMTREMGPLMTAIIIAGRSGSSFASEISSMKVNEELDALKSMGLNPIRFVVVPKFYAMTLCVPLLTILADVIGIIGGFFVAVTYLQLSPMTFINEVLKIMIVKDIITSIIKSFIFAWIIAIVGCFFGFRAEGGPEGVGRVTTQSVVVSIFMVIVADSILGLLFYF